jgi:hypothetical protein
VLSKVLTKYSAINVKHKSIKLASFRNLVPEKEWEKKSISKSATSDVSESGCRSSSDFFLTGEGRTMVDIDTCLGELRKRPERPNVQPSDLKGCFSYSDKTITLLINHSLNEFRMLCVIIVCLLKTRIYAA